MLVEEDLTKTEVISIFLKNKLSKNKSLKQNSKNYRKLQIEWKHRLKDYILNNGRENGSLHNREYQEKITLMKLKDNCEGPAPSQVQGA